MLEPQGKSRLRQSLLLLGLALGLLARPTVAQDDRPNGDYGGFYTWPEVKAKIAEWRQTYRAIFQESVLGKTTEGRDIPLLKISDNVAEDEEEPETLFIAGVHPREQPPLNCIMRLVEDLLQEYGKDPAITRLVNEREIWIVPVLNVDGKVYDMQHGNGVDRGADWRKNRRKNAGGSFGVDLNRNFGVRWGGNRTLDALWKTTTEEEAGNIYEGQAPLSEPETQALARFLRERPLRVFVDVHCPLHILLYPPYLSRSEYERYQRLLKGMRERQRDPYPVGESDGENDPPPTRRDGNTGLSYTWAYYTQGIYGFNFEIGREPNITGIEGRYLKPEWIDDEYIANVRPALLFLLETSAELPPASQGSAVFKGGTTDRPITPGAQVSWRPDIKGGEYAVLTSEDPAIVVQSEFRRLPARQGFTLEVMKSAPPGKSVPMTLYVWGPGRARTVVRFHLTITEAVSRADRYRSRSVTAPRLELVTSFAYLARTPRV